MGSKNKKVPKSLRQILTSSCFFFFFFKLQKQNWGRENHSLFIQFHLSFPLVLKHPQKNCTRQAFGYRKKVCQTKKKTSVAQKFQNSQVNTWSKTWLCLELRDCRNRVQIVFDLISWLIRLCGHSLTGQIKRQHPTFSSHDNRGKTKMQIPVDVALANSYSVISLTKPFDGCTSTLRCKFWILK